MRLSIDNLRLPSTSAAIPSCICDCLWILLYSVCIAMTCLNDWVGRESRRCECSSCEYDVRLPNVMPSYKLNSCGRTCSMTPVHIRHILQAIECERIFSGCTWNTEHWWIVFWPFIRIYLSVGVTASMPTGLVFVYILCFSVAAVLPRVVQRNLFRLFTFIRYLVINHKFHSC